MVALAADRLTEMHPDGVVKVRRYDAATGAAFFKGGLVCTNASGLLVPAVDTAAFSVVGVFIDPAVASAAAGSAFDVLTGIFRLVATSITAATIQQNMFLVDDQTFDEAINTNGVKAGWLYRVESATDGWLVVGETRGVGAVVADADGTYSSNEQDLLNELKTIVNLHL